MPGFDAGATRAPNLNLSGFVPGFMPAAIAARSGCAKNDNAACFVPGFLPGFVSGFVSGCSARIAYIGANRFEGFAHKVCRRNLPGFLSWRVRFFSSDDRSGAFVLPAALAPDNSLYHGLPGFMPRVGAGFLPRSMRLFGRGPMLGR